MDVHLWEEGGPSSVPEIFKSLDQETQIELRDRFKILQEQGIRKKYNAPIVIRTKSLKGFSYPFYELILAKLRVLFTQKEDIIWIVHIFKKQRQLEQQKLRTAFSRVKKIHSI